MNSKKVLAYAIGPIGTGALGLITVPVVAWFFPAEDIGRIAMLQVLSGFVLLVFSLGLDQAYVREYYEASDRSALLKICTLPGFFLLLGCCAIGLLVYPNILSEFLYGTESVTLTAYTVGYLILNHVFRFLSLVVRVKEQAMLFSLSQLSAKVAYLIFVVGFAFTMSGVETVDLFVANFASLIVAVTLLVLWTSAEWKSFLRRSNERSELVGLLQFGLPLVVSGFAVWLFNNMGRIFINTYAGLADLGMYSVVASLAGSFGIIATIFNTLWAPIVFRWLADGVDMSKMDTVAEYVLAAVFGIFVTAGLISFLIPLVIPDQYSSARYLLMPFMVMPLFYTLGETVGMGVSVARKTWYAIVSAGCAAAMNAIGCYLLVPSLGVAGAAISNSVAALAYLVLRCEFSVHAWRAVPRRKLYATSAALCSATVLPLIMERTGTLDLLIVWLLMGVLGLWLFKSSLVAAVAYWDGRPRGRTS